METLENLINYNVVYMYKTLYYYYYASAKYYHMKQTYINFQSENDI